MVGYARKRCKTFKGDLLHFHPISGVDMKDALASR